ncbi:CynX/NimT family MFS transporter [Oceanobacillus salinisoli]|uniref:CynX/NimT family MFS transporter n=1 Tax=Oceanobacillus salinisoli TaxID=2678611 RepID=UPI0012E0D7D0|nr:MFS transporter [Oceanobacillus salinisoli]
MDLDRTSQQTRNIYQFFLITGVILIAFNLRPAITSVGPLISTIREDLGLTNSSVGLLTSLPLIAFAIMSPIAPKLGNRYSNERAMVIGLILLLIGISIRSMSIIFLLFTGTLLIGLGIAILNVLLPSLIKDKFPNRIGVMTSVYSTAMGVIAATASGLSVPLASVMNLGWQFALFIWATPAILAIIPVYYLSRKAHSEHHVESRFIRSDQQMWKSPLAWQVALFMGTQSFLFYVTISWLPAILHDYGASMTIAGWLLSFTQFIGLPASFIVPVVAERMQSQRVLVIVMGLCSILGYGGLLIGQSTASMIISIILIGIALSGTFALALTFLGLRTKTARQAAELSGMAQTFGYILAAVGPILIGFLFDVSQTWTIPLLTILGISLVVMLFGIGAGRNKNV